MLRSRYLISWSWVWMHILQVLFFENGSITVTLVEGVNCVVDECVFVFGQGFLPFLLLCDQSISFVNIWRILLLFWKANSSWSLWFPLSISQFGLGGWRTINGSSIILAKIYTTLRYYGLERYLYFYFIIILDFLEVKSKLIVFI